MVHIILSGCNGRMGKTIAALCENDEAVKIVAGFDLNTKSDHVFPVFAKPAEYSGDGDVIIDFSHPSSLSGLLAFSKERGIPAVICTTGLSDEQKKEISDASQTTAMFFSANMSLGVNVMVDLIKRAAKIFGDQYDIEIIEKHHNQKVDAPSGTALTLADAMAEVVPYEPEYVYDRHSVRKKRDKREFGIHAVRGGTIVGEHDVLFCGNNEIITVSHSATSREVFAEGAIRAAKFLKGKKPGLYNMTDLVDSYNI